MTTTKKIYEVWLEGERVQDRKVLETPNQHKARRIAREKNLLLISNPNYTTDLGKYVIKVKNVMTSAPA